MMNTLSEPARYLIEHLSNDDCEVGIAIPCLSIAIHLPPKKSDELIRYSPFRYKRLNRVTIR